MLYSNGQGVTQDFAKACGWYEKAADKGSADAMFFLGGLYYNGQGVTRDYAKARGWYEKAADKGSADAMVNLGVLYENGQGVTRDYAKARGWYEKAADKDNAEAARAQRLAKMALELLPIHEAERAGRYDEALRLEEVFAANVEAEETKRGG